MTASLPPLAAGVRVTVVVCAFTEDRWDQIQRAVASLHRQTRSPDEVLVVIDHNEALLERARAGLDANVLRNVAAQGLSGARNSGCAAACGDLIAFLDDDAHAEPDWLERLLAAYAEPGVLGVGGGVEAAFDSPRPAFLPTEFDWVVGCSYRGQPTARADVRNMIGANMSFRREVFSRVGGFEQSLGRIGSRPLGCEETELCLRAQAAWPEGRIVLEPAARVHHAVPDARATWRYFMSRCYAEGLSKAAVARLAGAGRGLASERRYATRTLPTGVARGLSDALLRRRSEGLTRAAAICVGLALTTIGYASGWTRWPAHRREHVGRRNSAHDRPDARSLVA